MWVMGHVSSPDPVWLTRANPTQPFWQPNADSRQSPATGSTSSHSTLQTRGGTVPSGSFLLFNCDVTVADFKGSYQATSTEFTHWYELYHCKTKNEMFIVITGLRAMSSRQHKLTCWAAVAAQERASPPAALQTGEATHSVGKMRWSIDQSIKPSFIEHFSYVEMQHKVLHS